MNKWKVLIVALKKELRFTSTKLLKYDASNPMDDKRSVISDPRMVNWLQN